MLDINEIKKAFPADLHDRGEDMLREYLQYEIVSAIFGSKNGHKYTFLGGTCLRVAYGTDRFSEDLDFDNVGLTQEEFEETAALVARHLELLGYTVTTSFQYKGAFHCKIKFPGLFYDYDLSPHKEARLLIKLDTEKQHYDYPRKVITLSKFGVEADVRATPLPLLASQKVAAIMGRKRPKGRDFYDLRWILARTTPDYGYLGERFGVTTGEALRAMVAERIAAFDFVALGRDVTPFLFRAEDVKDVVEFPTFWNTGRLEN